MINMKEKILVSACLLGEKVRYDGKCQSFFHRTLQQWKAENRLVGLCPEVAGGLPIPRAPAEIQMAGRKVVTQAGEDVSALFIHGAQAALTTCQKHGIKYALLKESSPSCGSQTIYDGTFQQRKLAGEGITTELLRNHGIEVFSEKNIEELIERLKY